MNTKKGLGSRIKGWLPKEPLLKGHSAAAPVKPEVKAELDENLTKKLIKAISITNPIIGTIIFTSNSLSSWWNLANIVLTLVELIFVLLVVNVSIYLYLRHGTVDGGV